MILDVVEPLPDEQALLFAVIDPDDGAVTNWIDLTGLLLAPGHALTPDVLNGIAFDHIRRRLFVTGKNWPTLYEIELVPAVAIP